MFLFHIYLFLSLLTNADVVTAVTPYVAKLSTAGASIGANGLNAGTDEIVFAAALPAPAPNEFTPT
jgi:hypothetical protein